MSNKDKVGALLLTVCVILAHSFVSLLAVNSVKRSVVFSEVRITKHIDVVTDLIVNEGLLYYDMLRESPPIGVEEFTLPPTGGEIDCLFMDVPKPNDMNASGRIQCKFASGFPIVM